MGAWNEIMNLLFLTDYKQHQLPLARIKRIMKLDGAAKVSNDDALTSLLIIQFSGFVCVCV